MKQLVVVPRNLLLKVLLKKLMVRMVVALMVRMVLNNPRSALG